VVSVALLSTLLCAQNPRSSDAQTGTQRKLPADHSTSVSPIKFAYQPIPFELDRCETWERPAPETMAGGVAVFDYTKHWQARHIFTNGADIHTLRKSSPQYSNHLFENDGQGHFTDLTAKAHLAGTGYDIGVAIADYDNDGYEDIFVAGVYKTRSITTTETVLSRM
jgi:FG-GAP-like repeat